MGKSLDRPPDWLQDENEGADEAHIEELAAKVKELGLKMDKVERPDQPRSVEGWASWLYVGQRLSLKEIRHALLAVQKAESEHGWNIGRHVGYKDGYREGSHLPPDADQIKAAEERGQICSKHERKLEWCTDCAEAIETQGAELTEHATRHACAEQVRAFGIRRMEECDLPAKVSVYEAIADMLEKPNV